ncbi:MAG: ankyrin repeat-containing domain protein, partial [Olpidium bornovanus]
ALPAEENGPGEPIALPHPTAVAAERASASDAGGSSSSLDSVGSGGSGDGALSTAETVDDVQQDLFRAVCAEDRDVLAEVLDRSNPAVVLRALLTFQCDNRPAGDRAGGSNDWPPPTFAHDPEVLHDAQELLGAEVNGLNIIQCACFLGEEDLAIDILRYVDVQTERMGTRKILYELLGRVWGRGNTTLHLASFLGMSDLVRMLIKLGSNTNKRNDRKYKPVDCADDDSTRALFLNAAEAFPEHLAVASYGKSPRRMTTYLVLRPTDEPLLSTAPETGDARNTARAKEWTEHGKVKFDAQTLLVEASQNGDLTMLRYILDSASATEPGLHSAPLHQTSLDQTPLHLAAGNNHLEVCKFLVGRGASVNVQDAEGWTPLHCAVSSVRRSRLASPNGSWAPRTSSPNFQ